MMKDVNIKVNGKGDKDRVTNIKKFRDGMDYINWSKKPKKSKPKR